jgi:hypothetical protein
MMLCASGFAFSHDLLSVSRSLSLFHSARSKLPEKVASAMGAVKEKLFGAKEERAPAPQERETTGPTRRSIWATGAEERHRQQRPTSNSAVVFQGPGKVTVQDVGYPEMKNPHGETIDHGVILKVVATAICGSDLHSKADENNCSRYHGRAPTMSSTSYLFALCVAASLLVYRGVVPGVENGMVFGHEITGQIVEMGSAVERFQLEDFVSVPFHISDGKCDNCKAKKTNVCINPKVNPLGIGGAYGYAVRRNENEVEGE